MSAVFISHSSKDNEFAAELNVRLKEQGYRSVFLDFDPTDGIPPGRNWEQELYQRLRVCRAMVVLCSEHSMASDWCFAEITHARALGKHILPVKIGPCTIRTLLHDCQILDLTTEFHDAFQRLWRGLKAAGLDPVDAFDWDDSRPPYPGLLAFQEEDAAVFFGREAAIRDGLDVISRQQRFGGARLILFLGASGSGKSSLVRAGIVPRLRRDIERWLVVDPFRPLDRPFDALASTLAEAFARHGVAHDWKVLREQLQGSADGGTLVELARELRVAARQHEVSVLLVLDQVEELLAFAPDGEANRFLPLLRGALGAPGTPLFVAGTLRSDFLGDFQKHPALREMPFEEISVSSMSVGSFPQAIEGPARLAGLELEPGLVQTMIRDAETDDALPLLAFTLRELWAHRGDDRRLKIAVYRDELGGLGGSVARAAEDILAARRLSAEEEADLRGAFVSMVRINDEGQFARRPASWDALPARVHPLLERFVQARLLVSRSAGEARVLEVAHEALFRNWSRLAGWLEEDRAFLLWRKRLDQARDAWIQASQRRDALLRGPSLHEAERWLEQRSARLSRDERDFIRASIAADRRRRRVNMSIAATVSLVLAATGALAWVKGIDAQRAAERAEREAQAARTAGLVTLAQGLLDKDPLTASLVLTELTNAAEPQGGVTTARELLNRFVTKIILRGHQEPLSNSIVGIHSVAYSPDGRRVVTAGGDSTVRVWATEHGGQPVVLRGHEDAVLSAEFSPDGTRVVSASEDGTARVWDADGTGEPLVLRGHEGEVYVAKYSPDGKRIVTASKDGTARVWPADGVGDAVVLRGHEAWIWSAAFSPDGRLVATASGDNTARVWRVDGTDEVILLRGHEDAVHNVEFSPDGRSVVTGSLDRTARVWPVDGSGEAMVFKGHDGPVQVAHFSPDRTRLITGSLDGVRVWPLDGTGRAVLFDGGAVHTAVFSQDGRRILIAWHNGVAEIWDASGRGEPMVLRGHEGPLTGAAFSPDERDIVTASYDGTARIWTTSRTGEPVVLRGHRDWVKTAAFSPDGERIVTASQDHTARLWRADGRGEPIVLGGHTESLANAEFSRDGALILTVSWDSVRVWNADSTRQPLVIKGPECSYFDGVFSPDGTRVLTVCRDATARIWSVADTGEPVILRGHDGFVRSAFFSPDGERVVTASEDRTARVWNADGTGTAIVLQGHDKELNVARFSPDGTRVVTASKDGTARVWNADGTGEPIVLHGHGDEVNSAEFGPDGRLIATAANDNTARIWHAEGGGQATVLRGHTGWVYSATFSPDGTRVVTTSRDGTARVWYADGTGEAIVLQGHTDWLDHATFSPDGVRVVTASFDRTARVWTIGWHELVNRLRERTSLCLSPEQRVRYLLEARDEAEERSTACEHGVAQPPTQK